MLKTTAISAAAIAAITLSACVTTPKPEPVVEEVVVVEPLPVRTCSFESELTKNVIPAEYKEGFTINTVESAPEYVTDPVTGEVREVTTQGPGVKTPYKTLIKEEQIIYVNAENRVVTDICGDDVPLNAVKAPVETVIIMPMDLPGG